MVAIDADALAWKQQRELEKDEKWRDEQEKKALNNLLSAPEGRAFLWWLLRIGKVGLQPYAGADAATNFNCGELNVGQQIFARILETNPQGYLRMIEDQQDAERARAVADANNTPDRNAPGD